jgi:adenylylsulfate kinase
MSFTLWFMGLPASGKSTIAKRVESHLRDHRVPVENLDGDALRKNLHPDLGFSREDRATNNRRTAYICKLLNQNAISVVNGMITPFRDSQQQAREIIEPSGNFILIYLKCSVDEAARRDPKSLYKQAQEGKIKKFTGVNHPFQEPNNPEVVVDTEEQSVEESVEYVLNRIHELGLLDEPSEKEYGFEISRSEESKIISKLENLGYLDK